MMVVMGTIAEDLPTSPVLRGLVSPAPVGIHGVGTSPSASPPLARGLAGRLVDEFPPQCPKCRTQVKPVRGERGMICPACGASMEHRLDIASIFEDAQAVGLTSYQVPSPGGMEAKLQPPRKPDEIDAEWIDGIRKGWKHVYDKSVALRNDAKPPPESATDPMEYVRYLGQNAQDAKIAVASLLTFVRNLQSVLTFEKGFWTSSDMPGKKKPKKKDLFDQPVAKAHAELRDAADALLTAGASAQSSYSNYKPGGYAEKDLESGGTHYDLTKPPQWSSRQTPSELLNYQVSLLWERDLAEQFAKADAAIRRLLKHLAQLVKAWGVETGRDEVQRFSMGPEAPPAINHIEGFTAIFQDTPSDPREFHKKTYMGGPADAEEPTQDIGYRQPMSREKYISAIKYAAGKLRQAKMGHLLYGKIVFLPRAHGRNVDLEKKGFGPYAGADYHRDGDFVQAYMDPRPGFSSVLVHELGHRYFRKFMSAQEKKDFTKWFGRAEATTSYGASDEEEDFCELFAGYVMGSDWSRLGHKELTRDQRQRMEAFLGKKRKLEMKSFSRMMKMVEQQLRDGEVRHDEFNVFVPPTTSVLTPEERLAIEGFLVGATPTSQRYTTAEGADGIVYYDTRGRAVSGVVAQMDDSELLALAYERGYVPPAQDVEPDSFSVTVKTESVAELLRKELAEIVG